VSGYRANPVVELYDVFRDLRNAQKDMEVVISVSVNFLLL
jgi:hypothetical protein